MSRDVLDILRDIAPEQRSFPVLPSLEPDETHWFLRAHESGLLRLEDCDLRCPRRRRSGYIGSDQFRTPDQERRHLFSLPSTQPRLNREYIPHIAAYAKAIIGQGYSSGRSSFSRYRTFSQDAVTKVAGTGYETDAEFYALDGSIHLQIEAKSDPRQVARIADQLARARDLAELPADTVKEIEYVVELRPRYLWAVGPGSIEPPAHVFAVETRGRSAAFTPVPALPPPP